ncbi:4-hydroxybenzoate polyprenyltransferase [Serinibacter arcticus]|uniref:4-hydroxybenzoate polyprenyltransferase n=1 Tax=Serinibacter arcticus TaxID=1655435 RepID=A0A2U1ZVW5_9MICO|nr:UbiA family prenyltransferase [Serinibacter arcticus]PWD51080.1 4-hydroxybenzoate polyprenyltransferase [Serinibacter arcticus]
MTPRRPTAADLVELVRLPAVLSVPGDALAGAAASGWPAGRRTAVAPAAASCLYLAGMALNDYSDRELDAHERPERPIPSGRVTPGTALALAGGLTGAGLLLATGLGRRGFGVAAALAATVWTYDLVAKPTPLGPAVMGLARGLDVMLGACGDRAAVPTALATGAHTVAVTALARGEVHGSSPVVAWSAVATTAGVAGATVAGSLVGDHRPSWPDRAVTAGFAALYGVTVGRAQVAAAASPDAVTVRSATRTGIGGLLPLQAAQLAAAAAPAVGLVLVAAAPLLRSLARRVATT